MYSNFDNDIVNDFIISPKSDAVVFLAGSVDSVMGETIRDFRYYVRRVATEPESDDLCTIIKSKNNKFQTICL